MISYILLKTRGTMQVWLGGLWAGLPKKCRRDRYIKFVGPHSLSSAQTGLRFERVDPHKKTKEKKKLIFVYIGKISFGLLHLHFESLYEWKIQVLYIFECAKTWRIHRVCQSTNMMKMLNYQFIVKIS